MRTIDFNYVLIRNGADLGRIWPATDSAPSLRMSESGAIKTSLSGDFLPTVFSPDGMPIAGEEINWLADQIRPEMVIDGAVYPLGIFLPSSVRETRGQNGTDLTVLHVDAYDRCWQVKDHYTESLQYLAAGTNYVTAITQLLAQAGISLIAATPTAATLAEGREDWNVGTSFLTIINQLLSEINYNPLWFDASGTAIIEPASVPSAANITHVIDTSDPEVRVLPRIQRSTDAYSAPNVWICVCSNADKGAPMVATSENTNPQSPLSIARRGRRIAEVVQVSNIADQNALQAYANRLRNESLITSETISLSTGLLPGFGVDDVVGLHDRDSFDVCIERAWSMELRTGGTMKHTLEKVVISLV